MDIFKQVDDYIKNLLAPEDVALTETIDSLDRAGIPQISVSANQGKFLQVLMLASRARTVLELGTLGGYSTIWMARALPPDGKIVTVEIDPRHGEVARQNLEKAGVGHLAEVRIGPALEVLPRMIADGEGPFDFIFIDADKPPYPAYFELALQLSQPGTVIVCDNVVREGEVLRPDSTDERVHGVQQLNELLSRSTFVSATILQTVGVKEHDGMAIAVVR